jgi:hypothetical protein
MYYIQKLLLLLLLLLLCVFYYRESFCAVPVVIYWQVLYPLWCISGILNKWIWICICRLKLKLNLSIILLHYLHVNYLGKYSVFFSIICVCVCLCVCVRSCVINRDQLNGCRPIMLLTISKLTVKHPLTQLCIFM